MPCSQDRVLLLVLGATLIGCSGNGEKRAIGQSCTRDGECASTRCDELVCKPADAKGAGEPCSAPLECLSENCILATDGGTCGPGVREDGTPCTVDEQCVTGHCVAGTCGGTVSDGATPDAGSDGPLADGGSDSGPPPPQPLCAPFGPPTETPPATAGDARFVRPPFTEDGFCVQAAPIPAQSWGDAICQRDLGSAYVWGPDAAGTTEALEAGKEALDGDTDVTVLFIPPPDGSGGSWSVYGTHCSYGQPSNCGGSSFYPPDCVPPSWARGRLWCTKRSQAAVPLGVGEVRGSFDAAYDAVNQRYVVVYEDATAIRVRAIDAYGKSTAGPFTLYAYDAGDSRKRVAAPRLSVGRNAAGAARYFSIWDQDLGSSIRPGPERKRFALLGGDGSVISSASDFYAVDGNNTQGQHGVAFDADRYRFLAMVGATPSGGVSPIELAGRYFDAEGQAQGPHFFTQSATSSQLGFGGGRLDIVYHPTNENYLVVAGREVLVFFWNGTTPLHARNFSSDRFSALGVAANNDGTGYRLTLDRSGVASTVDLDSTAAWGTERALGTQEVGGPMRVAYLPQAGPGAIKGKYLAQNGRYHLWLNDDGTTCFPTLERAVIGGDDNGLLVPNTDTGGFAYLYEEGGALYAKFYLSNGDEY